MAPSTKGASGRATDERSMPLGERVRHHIIVVVGAALVTGFGAGVYMVDQFRVNPRDFQIGLLSAEIVKLRTPDPMSAAKSLNVPSCDGVKIRGVWPRRVAANDSFVIEGSAPRVPKFSLWLFASLGDGGPPYNPRGPVQLVGDDDWKVQESAERRGDSNSKHYQITLVGEAGEILIREYRRAMNAFTEEVRREWPKEDRRWPTIKSSLDWPGIMEMTSDMVPCGRPLQVVR